MNLLHLKYAVEVAATNSMTKAAENLYTSQPNLSRAIKGLEDNLGIVIFRRTPKGIYRGGTMVVLSEEIEQSREIEWGDRGHHSRQ